MVDLFIGICLFFIWCWDYPPDHPAKRFEQKFSFPFVHMGLWYGWAMFAPEPIQVNRRLRAVLTFADGTTEDWSPLGPDSRSKLINLLYARSFKSTGHWGLAPKYPPLGSSSFQITSTIMTMTVCGIFTVEVNPFIFEMTELR